MCPFIAFLLIRLIKCFCSYEIYFLIELRAVIEFTKKLDPRRPVTLATRWGFDNDTSVSLCRSEIDYLDRFRFFLIYDQLGLSHVNR